MITVNQPRSVPITCIAGDPKIGQYMQQGATLYRNSREPGIVHLVFPDMDHGGGWREVCR